MKIFKNKITHREGFTLIELLVVVAIIGLLASVVMASLNSARAKARDAKRMQDLKEMEKALALYYDDNGTYPPAYPAAWGGVSTGSCNYGVGNGTTSGATAYISGLTPKYISTLPVDPSGSTADCTGYLYSSNGSDYKFLIYTTVETFHPGATNHSLRDHYGYGGLGLCDSTTWGREDSLAIYSPCGNF